MGNRKAWVNDKTWIETRFFAIKFKRGEKARIKGAPNDELGVVAGVSIGYDDTIIYCCRVRQEAIYPYQSEYVWLPEEMLEKT